MMAVTQVRNRGSEGRAYYERKRLEGKTGKEARRCLKRRLSDVIYRQLIADQAGTIEVRITYDQRADTAYLHLTDQPLRPGQATTRAPAPGGSTPPSRSTGAAVSSSALRSSMPARSCPPTFSITPNSSANRQHSVQPQACRSRLSTSTSARRPSGCPPRWERGCLAGDLGVEPWLVKQLSRPAHRTGTRGARARRRRAAQPGHRRPPVRHRAHRRGAVRLLRCCRRHIP
jgi:hypothetical protein